MAANFSVRQHQGRDGWHLTLKGDFDGSAALELICILKKRCDQTLRIFIHTEGISAVLPFGRGVFQRRCALPNRGRPILVFTGKHARKIALRENNSTG